MDAVLRIAEKTSGRDKLCRLVQYGSKTVSWGLEVKGASSELVEKIKALEASISTARKLFRIGMSIESLRSALRTIHLASPVLRVLITLARICRGLYLLIDHLLWASRMKLVSIDDRFWSRLSSRFWLAAIFICLLRDLYEVVVSVKHQRNRLSQYGSSTTPVSPRSIATQVFQTNPALLVDTVKNITDFWIPASRLDLVYIPGGVVGLAGVISSLAGILGSHNQQWRLKFS